MLSMVSSAYSQVCVNGVGAVQQTGSVVLYRQLTLSVASIAGAVILPTCLYQPATESCAAFPGCASVMVQLVMYLTAMLVRC
jgi:hypothetical protein